MTSRKTKEARAAARARGAAVDAQQRRVEAVLRDIRTESLQDQIAGKVGLGPHDLLRMFVLALCGTHVSVTSRAHTYVRFDDLAEMLLTPAGGISDAVPLRRVEEIAREAIARMARVDQVECPAGEWLWAASFAQHPEYYTPEVQALLDDAQRHDIERGTRPWIPGCVQEQLRPVPIDEGG